MTNSKLLPPSSVLLAGRANVGKSTLFNRLLNQHQAITSPEAGTTRDLNRALLTWRGKNFWLIDSLGFMPQSREEAQRAGQKLLQQAWREATVIVHLVDGQTGLTPEDRQLAKQFRKTKAHLILAINKIDSPAKRIQAADISLGYPDSIMISAQTGSGVGDLLDIIWQHLKSTAPPSVALKLAFIGQTNVGKSSLFNALLKKERSLVLPTPHTTRDRVRDYLMAKGLTIELIDTAGLRRQLNKAPLLEKQSAQQSLRALKQIDVALLIIDGSKQLTWQDQHIAQQIIRAGTAAVVVLTKADLVPPEERAQWEKKLNSWLPMLSWAKRLWVSAISGEGLNKLLPLVQEAAASWRRNLTETELNSFYALLKQHRLTKSLPVVNFIQTAISPPSFNLSLRQKTNPPSAIADWVETQLRRKFGFPGTPLRVQIEAYRHQKTK